MAKSVTKGKLGEREACEVLNKIISSGGLESVFRAQPDPHGNGADIMSIPGLAIEVKRHETLALGAWWRQAQIQGDNISGIPVVMYRQNRQKWKYLLPAYLLILGSEDFIQVEASVFEDWFLGFLRGALSSLEAT